MSDEKQSIMLRHTCDTFDALWTANGMEAAGASVFAITKPETGETVCVWAKYSPPLTPDIIDTFIEAERNTV